MVAGSKIRVRQQSRFGLQAKTTHLFCCHGGDLAQLFSRWVVVDMRIDQEHLAIRQQQTIHTSIGTDTFAVANDLVDVIQMHIGRAPGATNQAVDFTFVQHHGANQRQATTHIDLGQLLRHALARHHVPIGLPKIAIAVVLLHVDHLVVFAFLQAQSKFLNTLRNDGGAANQCRFGQAFVHHDLHRAQNALFFTLGKTHALLGA